MPKLPTEMLFQMIQAAAVDVRTELYAVLAAIIKNREDFWMSQEEWFEQGSRSLGKLGWRSSVLVTSVWW
jgi:hypothetical protein